MAKKSRKIGVPLQREATRLTVLVMMLFITALPVQAGAVKLAPAAKAEVENMVRKQIGVTRSHLGGLLSQMKGLEKELTQQEKDMGQLFEEIDRPGLVERLRDKTKAIKNKFIK